MSLISLRSDDQEPTDSQLASAPPTVVGIGNFDGLHQGHMALIKAVKRAAETRGLCPSVLTFDPHPLRFFRGEQGPRLIYSTEDRVSLLERHGVERVHLQHFDRGFASLSPADFVERLLVGRLKARHVVVGHDFAFGARRAGNVETLRALGAKHGLHVEVIEAQRASAAHRGEEAPIFSSTWIRALLSEGEVSTAAQALGRVYHLRGTVRRGHQRGRELGFPTANLELASEICPHPGVYAGWLDWGEGPQASVISVGDNPTINQTHTLARQQRWSIEAHVLQDASASHWLELYDLPVVLWFSERLRAMEAFSGLEALKAQIMADSEAASAHAATRPAPEWPTV